MITIIQGPQMSGKTTLVRKIVGKSECLEFNGFVSPEKLKKHFRMNNPFEKFYFICDAAPVEKIALIKNEFLDYAKKNNRFSSNLIIITCDDLTNHPDILSNVHLIQMSVLPFLKAFE